MAAPPSPILILTNQLHTGGAEAWVLAVSRWLTDQGAHVEVAAAHGELVAGLDDRVRYHDIDLKDLRARVPLAAWKVRRVLATCRPAVILANSLVTAWVGKLAGGLGGPPVVAIAHGWAAERYKLVGLPLNLADRVVPVSDDVARRLMVAGLHPKRVHTVFNGIDLSPFGPRSPEVRRRARQAMGAGDDEVVAINVGRYVEQKAQHHIIDIAARLRTTLPELRYAVVGWGPREAELAQACRDAGVDDIVRLMGRRTDVPDLLDAADLYLSVSDWEGMPLSMIEAMAAGLPIVTTDVEGIGPLVDRANGQRCPPGDVASLTEAVARLGRDEVLRLSLGEASRQRAATRFSLDAMGAGLVEVLRAVAR